MQMLKKEKIIDVMQKTLDCVDCRLIDHGKRVAYFVFKTLESQGRYTDKQLHDICILAMLHDIGAYKTDEIDKMVIFETVDIWEHSIYGYLFFKYFSPLAELAPVIYFHHADCREMSNLDSSYHDLAQVISLCDRADFFLQAFGSNMDGFGQYIEKNRDIQFRSDIVDLFLTADIHFDLIDEKLNTDEKFHRILYDTGLTGKEIDDYIKMIILSIDFRSRHTVIHTIATVCISKLLASLHGLSEEVTEEIMTGAMLHDIGKMGIPVQILESSNHLNETEMEVMKTHVDITEKIITGSVSDRIKQIVARHHEKLNGKGYPKGLSGPQLSLSERIVAVADIFSALCGERSYKDAFGKEKIIDILNDMSAQGFIDARIVSLAIEHFDWIMTELNKESQPVIEAYDKINEEYDQLRALLKPH